MNIRLYTDTHAVGHSLTGHYDAKLEDIRSVLDDLGNVMADYPGNVFSVSGFGDEAWPVDVRTDLSVFLEQLPAALRAVMHRCSFTIDFYEQGIERRITFTPTADRFEAVCECFSDWQPDPNTITIRVDELLLMLIAVHERFVDFFDKVAPSVAKHPWFRDWVDFESSQPCNVSGKYPQ